MASGKRQKFHFLSSAVCLVESLFVFAMNSWRRYHSSMFVCLGIRRKERKISYGVFKIHLLKSPACSNMYKSNTVNASPTLNSILQELEQGRVFLGPSPKRHQPKNNGRKKGCKR